MGYCSASSVAAFCQNILGPENSFGDSTSPTLVEVNNWISSGCGILEAHLGGLGYDVPIGSGAVAYGWIRDLNTYYAAAMVEHSRTLSTIGPGERSRGMLFEKMFWDGLERFGSVDLSRAGMTRSSVGTMFVGGISKTSKDAYNSDSDRVAPRFKRNFVRLPGTVDDDTDTDD